MYGGCLAGCVHSGNVNFISVWINYVGQMKNEIVNWLFSSSSAKFNKKLKGHNYSVHSNVLKSEPSAASLRKGGHDDGIAMAVHAFLT